MSKNGEMEMASFGCVWEWVVIGSVRRRLEAKKFKTSLGEGAAALKKNEEAKSWPAAWNERDRFRFFCIFF